jgi:peptidoglycan/xylan/chitin deacetylase (PgdA/CDA1 family)
MSGPAVPKVALTFDDGPSPEHTARILDILAARGARATFFVLGANVEREPELTRRIAKEHELGCHSFDHARGVVRDLATFRADVARCREVFGRVAGVQPRFYRFPWGEQGGVRPKDVLALEQLTCVRWSASGHERESPERIARSIDRRLEPGAILLLHDGLAPGSVYPRPRDATVAALPKILDAIERRGLAPVTLSELLA